MTLRLGITGANGFVGRHLAREATERSHAVVGFANTPVEPGDVLRDQLERLDPIDLTTARPDLDGLDAVVHLAGLAAVGPSFDDPIRYVRDNTAMLVNVCEGLLAADRREVRVLVVSTGAVYEAGDHPQSEDSPLGVSSPYAVSKRTVEDLSGYYRRRGLDVVVARPFNHIGPGQAPGFIVPDLYQKLVDLAPGADLEVGDLTTARDYTDVRDVAGAYLSLVEAAELGSTTYNVASGASTTGRELLGLLCAAMGREVPGTVQISSRPSDSRSIVGDAERLRAETGWGPRIPIDRSVADFVAAKAASV